MSGQLFLNITPDNTGTATGVKHNNKKGGRWTERLKAKRVAKRKERTADTTHNATDEEVETRPSKRVCRGIEPTAPQRPTPSSSRRPTQYISSLFSYNPQISKLEKPSVPRPSSKPSNAPVDASTFEDLGLSPLLVTHLSTKMGINKPTGIQHAALPSLLQLESRDAFIQSQTGSGKTLSFLLPIIQDLLPLSSLSYIDRSIGTLAIIIAPTRELAKQISDVLETILTLRLRPTSDDQDLSSQRLTRWLVSGLLTGGATRTHEKARLRKGIPILVSTPGRLLDHLQNTSAFNVGKCRWLVLDEADRLMDLGFEETIQGILKSLDGRRKLDLQADEEGTSFEGTCWEWRERRNILCSATIREDVQKLAGVALRHPVVIRSSDTASITSSQIQDTGVSDVTISGENFTPPSQLAQKFVVVPLKLRLVTLVALLRRLLGQSGVHEHQETKLIVFLSCTDSVDFHWNLLGGATMDNEGHVQPWVSEEGGESPHKSTPEKIRVNSTLLPNTSIYRLHGSLSLRTRLASLQAFSSKTVSSDACSILLCTSVASRGLDLPLVRAVIQYDLPTEGGATEYIHRVGRTARVGRGGEAWTFVGPSEEAWVSWVQERMGSSDNGKGVILQNVSVETVLKDGFAGKGKEYEARSTQVQLAFERWVLQSLDHAELARNAYLSHMRAYATHPSDEKHIFHVRHLHLGHLAKAFALREAPNTVKEKTGKDTRGTSSSKTSKGDRRSLRVRQVGGAPGPQYKERVMRHPIRKGGNLVINGVSEFQIADGKALQSLIHG